MQLNVTDRENCSITGFVRDVREEIIMRAMGMCFENSAVRDSISNGGSVEISRSSVEEMVKLEIAQVGENASLIIENVFKRLREKSLA